MPTKEEERRYFKDGRKATSGLAVVIAIIIFILIGVCIATFVAANFAIDAGIESTKVSVQVNVLGNDIVVEIIGGERVRNLQYIYLMIDGYEIPDAVAGKAVAPGVSKIVYSDIAHMVSGVRLVGVRGYFDDGNTLLLMSKEIRFT